MNAILASGTGEDCINISTEESAKIRDIFLRNGRIVWLVIPLIMAHFKDVDWNTLEGQAIVGNILYRFTYPPVALDITESEFKKVQMVEEKVVMDRIYFVKGADSWVCGWLNLARECQHSEICGSLESGKIKCDQWALDTVKS